jgi:endo-1,4-beta-mannosidase
MRISRRSFVKDSISCSVAAAAGLTISAGPAAAFFPATQGSRLRFGANYVPRKHWWYCWQDWDQQAIREDLSGLGELGLDHIRIQCLWPVFQPGISNVSDVAVEHLQRLLDSADNAGLDVEVTVLNGWMSGLQYLPAWVAPLKVPTKEHTGNIFTDREVIEAEKSLFERLAKAVAQHRRFLGFDVGNELGVLQAINNPVTSEQADAWGREMLAHCAAVAPGKFHVNGADHSHWFADFGFSRQNLAFTGDATVVHSYIFFTGALDHYKYWEPGSLHLAEFMVELAYAYQSILRRRVWVEEIGASPEWMQESYMPVFMENTVRNIASTGKAWGITWWCSHDIDPAVKGFEPLEYTLGLLDVHNKPKTLGRKFAALAAEMRRTPPEVPDRPAALVVPDKGLSKNASPPDWTYAKAFMALLREGRRPTIVLESNARDHDYLQARGIRELIQLSKVRT